MKIKYFYDPLCGWCYGASPALEKAESLGISIESYPTGLFAQNSGQVMSPQWAEYAWTNDQRIQKITGQIFSDKYRNKVLSNFGVRFDSYIPTVAVLAHESKFKNEGLKFLRTIQKARYIEGLDNTNPEVLSEIAKNFGWSSEEFLRLILDQKFQELTRLKLTQNLEAYEGYQAKGVPLIVIEEKDQERILSSSLVFNKNPNPLDWFQC